MSEEQRIELVFGVQGQGELAKAETAIEKTGKAAQKASIEVYDFADSYEVLDSKVPAVKKDLAAVDAALDEVARSGKQAAAAVEQVGTAAIKTTEKARNYGQGLQQVAFTAQDFMSAQGDISRGLFAIQNNLPGLVTLFGGTAGLAGGIGIAGLALGVALPYITEWVKQQNFFAEAAKKSGDSLKDLKDRIEELQKKEVKIPVEIMELEAARQEVEKIEASLKEVQALKEARPEAEVASGKAIAETLAGAPGGGLKLHEQLKEQMVGALQTTYGPLKDARKELIAAQAEQTRLLEETAEFQKAGAYEAAEYSRAQAERAVADMDKAQEKINAVQAEILKPKGIAEQRVGDIMREAKTGTGAEQARGQAELQRLLTAAGRGELAGKVGEASPEAMARKIADKKLTEVLEKDGAAIEAAATEELRLIAAEKALTNSLTDQGAAIEEQMREDQKREAEKDAVSVRKRAVEANKAFLARETAGIKAGGYEESAALLMAQTKAQGGAMDAFGRFHKMTDDQIFDYVQNEVAKYLHRPTGEVDQFGRMMRANPQMGREETGDVATRITSMAQTAMQQSLGQNQGNLIGVVQDLSAEHDRFLMEQARQAAEIRGLRSNGRARQRTAANNAQ